MSPRDPFQLFCELKEFASFSAAEQRYIRRSLDVAFDHKDAIDHWARGLEDAASMGRQARVYDVLDELRSLISEDIEPDDTTRLLPLLTRLSAYDLRQGKLTSFAAYRFLYERLLGASVRPWLLSAFGAAAALPCVHPELRAELLRSVTITDMSASGWTTQEASFFPEWVEKVPLAIL